MKRRLYPLMLVALLGSASVLAQLPTQVDVYKSPSCDCCARWIVHMQAKGFKVKTHDVADIPASRQKLGMPEKFGSCHTARIGGYIVEGHVPATDVQRLLKEKPKALGLAVPSMPPGAPGMDIPNSPPYETLLVQADGSSRIFATH